MFRTPELPCMTDPDLFFSTSKAKVEQAKRLCHRCTLQQNCLAEALEFEALGQQTRHGIYGGLTPEERTQLTTRKTRITTS